MVFTSLDYALLLLLTFIAYWGLPNRWSSGVLLAASLLFYAFWSVPFLGLLLGCVALGYAAGRFLEGARGRRVRARAGGVAAVAALLGVLGVFKYSGLIGQAWEALGGAALDPAPAVLPLAISFYVFQILGYVIDVWRGRAAERSPLRFTLFVSFFPQLDGGADRTLDPPAPSPAPAAATRGQRHARRGRCVAAGCSWATAWSRRSVIADNGGSPT